MQIEQLLTNPYLFRKGGQIEGDYKFQKGTKVSMEDDADIEMEAEEARLQMRTDADNYLCFRDNETYINKDLEVGGHIRASALDVDTIDLGENLEVKGNLTVEGNTDVQTLTAHDDTTFTKTITVDTIDVQNLTAHEDATFDKKITIDTIDVQHLSAHEDATFDKKITADTIEVLTNLIISHIGVTSLNTTELIVNELKSNMRFDTQLQGHGNIHVYDSLQYKHTKVQPGYVTVYAIR